MNRATRNGIILAAIHLALVASLGLKLLADRATRPRVWVRAAPVDPNLPIRGRYVSLRLEVDRFENMAVRPGQVSYSVRPAGWTLPKPVSLAVRDGQLVAVGSETYTGAFGSVGRSGDRDVVQIGPVAFFISETAADPSRRRAGDELWVEVTVPRRGTPRPIRLGVKKDGVLTPLVVR